MGAYKNGDARYDIVSTRLSTTDYCRLQRYAKDTQMNISDALRVLLTKGLEVHHAEHSVSDVQEIRAVQV